MSHISAMKHIGSRNVGYKIGIMEWSNKMDLIAVSNDKGDVIIYRLNWQKIWTHPSPEENIKVRAISWRPDEKIISIAYSNGTIVLLDVENKDEIHSFCLGQDIVNMSWTQNTKEIIVIENENNKNITNAHKTFLPSLPNLNSLSSTPRKCDYTSSKSLKQILNILIICLRSGVVHLSVFGMLPCGSINICKHLNVPALYIEIIEAKLSSDFKLLCIMIKNRNELQLVIFENSILWSHTEPLLNLAIKHFHILNTMNYINDTIQSIVEAWETVLLEMDNKLTKYADSQSDGFVSADFLELLMFGYPSESLEQFLTRDLTEKGLKKLGNCIELSYSTIQKLVVRPLHSAILNICFHLNCIKGMSQNTYYYQSILGKMSNDAIKNAGAFLIKSFELQQTIDQSTRDYKIFFRWLYVAIIRLMDETVPEDIATVTQQEINYLADFLNNFDKGHCEFSNNPRRFNLERVGQYLEDKNLIISPKDINIQQHWENLIEENECLVNCEFIYPHHKKFSLIQQHKLLKQSIQEVFQKPELIIGNDFKLKQMIKCMDIAENNVESQICFTHFNIEKENVGLFATLESKFTMIFIEVYQDSIIKSLRLQFQQKPYFDNKFSNFGELSFRHIQFYNENILSILLDCNLNDKIVSGFIQFSLSNIRSINVEMGGSETIDISKSIRIINMYDVIDPLWIRIIDGFDWNLISVSGNRKVASILSESCKRIRFYEMEVEEEDEELDISQNNSLDTSKDSNI